MYSNKAKLSDHEHLHKQRPPVHPPSVGGLYDLLFLSSLLAHSWGNIRSLFIFWESDVLTQSIKKCLLRSRKPLMTSTFIAENKVNVK